jgi:asparagine synthase (glutamine-hydrolysing)
MCGICGIINFGNRPVPEPPVRKMMQKMKHRGPDDEGTFFDTNVGLGFVRLSIIDLSANGHQPMVDPTGRFVILLNGEIYNYIEIREELRKKDYTFRSSTDTEVLLYSYIEWGEDCLDRFNGMWAFTIYDRQQKKLFAARDRFGVKPFYYYLDEQQFVFASDIPPLLGIAKNIQPDNRMICDYLLYNRTDQDENTFYSGIKKLQHGHKLVIDKNNVSIRRWYDLKEHLGHPFESPEEYRQLFSDAVRLRLRSDVPVGVCLSGGLDSSAIVSVLLKDLNKHDISTFSAIFGEDFAGDETEYINEFRSTLNNMYFTSPSADTFYNDLPEFMSSHSEPLPTTSPYAQYKVMEKARDHVVVLLDGQGADEQLAGYHYFFGFYYKELLRKLKLQLLIREMTHYQKNHLSSYALKSLGYLLLSGSSKVFFSEQKKKYIRHEFLHEYSSHSVIVDNLYKSKDLKSSLLNHFEYKLEHLLKWEDRNSMWFSLEARVPFLDYRLVERTLALPSESILKSGTTKYILREAMKGYLPEKIRTRHSKVGFVTPDNEWFRDHKFKVLIMDILNSAEFRHNQYINCDIALSLYSDHLSGKINISRDIWKWINLSWWLKNF